MLAAVNVFLLVLVSVRDWKSARFNDSAREEAVSILAQNGIQLDQDLLPKDTALTALTVTRDPEAEAAAAAGLLGEDTLADGDGMTYHGGRGTAKFYINGEFYAEFPPGAYPLNGADPSAFAVERMAAMGFEAVVTETAADGSSVTLCQRLDGVPVFTCQAVLEFQNGDLVAIRSGSRRLIGPPQAGASAKPLSVPTILLRLLSYVKEHGDICNEITDFTLGYVLDTQTSPNRLLPTWLLTTDAGSAPGLYSVNALTGEVKNES